MSEDTHYRIEKDSMGEVKVPADALYGAQTQRALDNFPVSGLVLPAPFLHALGLVKACAARTNGRLGELDRDMAEAIARAADEVAEGRHDDAFPVDVFQTGSGTSSNMNANEVIASLASRQLGVAVHPNDHVNRGQSSNDVIPTAIHISARLRLQRHLLPALQELTEGIERRARELERQLKTGRTHLMDALPLTLGQELGGWAAQLRADLGRFHDLMPRLEALAQGGGAVGTGANVHPDFAREFAQALFERTGVPFRPADNPFAAMAAQDTAVEVSGQLRVLATGLMKIANDLRWMNSGPLGGLGEIRLPALQPGSSMMPGKVNPVIPEAVAMVCVQVTGHDAAIAMAGASGNFQLNVMLPLIAHNLLQGIDLLGNAMRLLHDKAIAGFVVDTDRLASGVARNPILATALNPAIGYAQASAIAGRAYREGRPVLEVAVEMTDLPREELLRLLDPARLAGISGRDD